MKRLTGFIAGLLIASSAFASTQTSYNDHYLTEQFETRSEAINAAFAITDSLHAMTQNELLGQLTVLTNNDISNVRLQNTKILVNEYPISRNEVLYSASVDVNFHYDTDQ